MSSKPRCDATVVIPTYNRRELVSQAVESVLSQTCKPFEIIVIDDGSTDGTKDVLQRYGNTIKYIYQQNAGVSAARNCGFRKSQSQLIAFLDSDDAWLPRMLEVLVAGLNRNPSAVAAAANCIIRSGTGDSDLFNIRGIDRPQEERLYGGILGAIYQPITSGILIHRNAFETTGGFDTHVLEYEDFDLWTRLSLCGDWVFCKEVLWVHNREVLNASNVSQKYYLRPLEAYQSLFRAHLRLLNVKKCTREEMMKLKYSIGNYRCIVGALSIDKGYLKGFLDVFRSAFDWPSPRRLARAAAVFMGWRPPDIRQFSQKLRSDRL